MASKAKPIVLTGNVFCDWNCFTFICPKPDNIAVGDLVVWSWSGDSKKPSSRSSAGLLRVSVFDGKKRRTFKVKRTRVHQHLKFAAEGERERKLSVLIPELRALKGRTLEAAKGGMELAPLVVAPAPEPEQVPAPTPAPNPARRTAARSAGTKDGTAVQGTLFD